MRNPLELTNEHDDGRAESPNQRMDRNWVELLQELRVTQTAVQILGGFLLALAFQPRFAGLSLMQRSLYVGLMTLAATTIVGGLAPVYLHRAFFRQGRKLTIVAFGHAVLKAQLIAVALIVLGTVLLVLDVAVGGGVVLGVAGALGAAVLLIAASPVVLTRRERNRKRRHSTMADLVGVWSGPRSGHAESPEPTPRPGTEGAGRAEPPFGVRPATRVRPRSTVSPRTQVMVDLSGAKDPG